MEQLRDSAVFVLVSRRLDQALAQRRVLSDEFSFYVRNSSITDPTDAPEGHSSVYVLVPVPNNKAGIDWEVARDALLGVRRIRLEDEEVGG